MASIEIGMTGDTKWPSASFPDTTRVDEELADGLEGAVAVDAEVKVLVCEDVDD